MVSFKGILYQSGNIEFPRSANEWAFERMQSLRSDQQKRIVMKPEVAPLELTRSPELDEAETTWLDSVAEIINACSTVNLQLRESTLRLRKAVYDIDDSRKLVILVSQEAIDEFAREHWQRIAYFYASRHDGFRFDLGTMISMKAQEEKRPRHMELVTRLVDVEGKMVPSVTFDATGSHADVDIVEWRGSVSEGDSGLFKKDDIEIRLMVPLARRPIVFLYEHRKEFMNHAYIFSGEKFDKQMRRMLKNSKRTAAE